MSKVVNISSHPKFSKRKSLNAVRYSPIFSLDGDMIEHNFVKESNENQAVLKFLCDMGFVIWRAQSGSHSAMFESPCSDQILFEKVPFSFNNLTAVCGAFTFQNKHLTYPQSVMLGKLGVAANRAKDIWEQNHKFKIA